MKGKDRCPPGLHSHLQNLHHDDPCDCDGDDHGRDRDNNRCGDDDLGEIIMLVLNFNGGHGADTNTSGKNHLEQDSYDHANLQ